MNLKLVNEEGFFSRHGTIVAVHQRIINTDPTNSQRRAVAFTRAVGFQFLERVGWKSAHIARCNLLFDL